MTTATTTLTLTAGELCYLSFRLLSANPTICEPSTFRIFVWGANGIATRFHASAALLVN